AIGVMALRGVTNERDAFLMSTLPVVDLAAPPASGIQVIPDYADGGGGTTNILLVNPTNITLTGSLQFFNSDGTAANTSFSYDVPARSSQNLSTAGTRLDTASGSVRVNPTAGVAPASFVIFSFRTGGVTVSEAGVSITTGTALRMYVEAS